MSKASLLQFLVIAMLAFWVADWILSRGGHKRLKWQNIFASPLHLPILIFGLVAILATAASIAPAISFWGGYSKKAGLLNLICWILFFLILAQQIRNRDQLLRAVYTLLLSSGIVSILGIIQYFFPDVILKVFQNARTYGHRVFSTIGNPLFLSSFLAMVIPFSLALIAHFWSKRAEGNNTRTLIVLVILLALQFWCLWLAQYSITILLFIIAPIVFIILLGWIKRKKLLLSIGVTCLLALGIIAAVLIGQLLLSSPVSKTTESEGLQSEPISDELELQNLGGRIRYWQSTIDLLLESPEVPFSNDNINFARKIIGYGPETFTSTFQLFFPEELKRGLTESAVFVGRPHNDYLYLAATMGLLGLMSFLAILAVFFFLCFGYLHRVTTGIDRLLLIAMIAGMLQYMADIFFNLSTISPELVFWLMLAMASVMGKFIPEKKTGGDEYEKIVQPVSSSASHVTRTRFIMSVICAVALIIIGAGIAARPLLGDIYLQKGLNLLELGRSQQVDAERSRQILLAFDRSVKIMPGEAIYWYYLSQHSYYVARHIKEEAPKTEFLTIATNAGEKARTLDPYYAHQYHVLADVFTYWAETGDTNKWPTALSLYDAASQLFPGNSVIINKWALALIIKGDFNEARTKLDYSASIDPDWAKTSFLYSLLLAQEEKNDEAVIMLIAPIHDNPARLNSFIDLCGSLMVYDMIKPLMNSLEIYIQKVPDDWVAHALLGITSLFDNKLNRGITELNTSM
ncbi:MAG: O-antigen ligase family protein, partial [Chloroflexota bacterium]